MKWAWPTVWDDERGGWWRVAVTLVLFVLGCLLGNLLLLMAYSTGLNNAMKNLPMYMQEMARPIAILFNASFGLAGCLIGVRFIHHKPVACVFTDGRAFSFTFAIRSAALWLFIWFAGASLIPARYEVIHKRVSDIPVIGLVMLTVVIFCVTTVQGTLEEVVFRGYLQPRVGAWVKRPWIAVIIICVIFVAGHPDAWTAPGFFYIASFGLVCGVAGLRSGTLAPLCGLHAAENAMNWLWFPHDSNAADTWPMACVTAAGLTIWLIWLFWTTRRKPTNTLELPDIGLPHEHIHTA